MSEANNPAGATNIFGQPFGSPFALYTPAGSRAALRDGLRASESSRRGHK